MLRKTLLCAATTGVAVLAALAVASPAMAGTNATVWTYYGGVSRGVAHWTADGDRLTVCDESSDGWGIGGNVYSWNSLYRICIEHCQCKSRAGPPLRSKVGDQVKLGRVLGAAILAAVAAVAVVAPASNAAPPNEHSADVLSIVHNADGTITETSYTPAPGVSAEQLAKRLSAQGVTNVSIRDESAIGTQATACSYGSARTWPSSATCFVRWSYSGYSRPQIYFIDHSSSAWPVGRAVTKWNETSGIDSVYRTSGCPGGGIHCPNVYSGSYGSTGWVGLTSRTLNSAATYYSSAYVKLNDSYGGTAAQHRNTACHELGHVLGLGHNTSTAGCLYYSRTSALYPESDDFNLLERYY